MLSKIKKKFAQRKCAAGQRCGGQISSGFCCPISARTFWLRFMGLPVELRENIYTQMFADLPYSIVPRPESKRRQEFPPIAPAVCYTDKRTLSESIPALLRGRQLHIGSAHEFDIVECFLDRVPEKKAWKAVTAVQIRDSYGQSVTADFISKCLGVRSVHIEYSAAFCVKFDDERNMLSMRSMTELRDVCRIASVFTLPNLQKVVIDCVESEAFATVLGCEPTAVFENYVALLNDEREHQGAKFEIEFRYLS